MKVTIITEGGLNIGLGHIMRCLSVYQAFEERNINVKLIVNSDNSVDKLLENKNYKIFNWVEKQQELFDLIKDNNVVIIDSYLAEISFYKKISELVEIPVYIDDNNRLEYPKGFVLNGNIHAKELNYPANKDIKYLLGTEYTPLRKEFWDVPEKVQKEKINNVMIVLGGNDIRNLTPLIMGFLKRKYPFWKKNIIIGSSFSNIDAIKKEIDENTNLIYYPDAQGMKEIMLKSDMAISAGGQTLYELARIGVPTIGICVAENQIGNIQGWQKVGFLDYTDLHNESTLSKEFTNIIERLQEESIREEKSKIGKHLVDGKGSYRVVKDLLACWLRNNLTLRRTTLNDAMNLFKLSNDNKVRENSFTSEKIEWETHLKWLTEKLADNNVMLFVISDNLDGFYGQVRFDIEDEINEAVIGISLEKSTRGLGLAPFVLNKAVEKFLETKNVKLIRAYIKEENTSSIKSFEKAGFRFFKDLLIKGNKSKLYIRD